MQGNAFLDVKDRSGPRPAGACQNKDRLPGRTGAYKSGRAANLPLRLRLTAGQGGKGKLFCPAKKFSRPLTRQAPLGWVPAGFGGFLQTRLDYPLPGSRHSLP